MIKASLNGHILTMDPDTLKWESDTADSDTMIAASNATIEAIGRACAVDDPANTLAKEAMEIAGGCVVKEDHSGIRPSNGAIV